MSNIYVGGRLLAVENPSATSYLTTDHLGSPRITTDGSGNTISRRDFHPFGEEIYTAQRTVGLGYTADTVRQKFATYQRDTETNLDYAKARMFGSGFGRFTSPDPLMASAKRIIPQSWNRYTYVLNNPLNLVDPSGMIWGYYDVTKNGTTERHFCYAPGDALCKGYRAYNGPRILDNTNYGTIRLNNNGTITNIDVPRGGLPRGSLSAEDATVLRNATGGAICSITAGLACDGDPNSSEYQGAKTSADVIQTVFLIKSLLKAGISLAAIAAIIKKDPEDVVALARAITFKGFGKGKLLEHFERHGSEFGNITQNQYLKLAKTFAGESGDDIVEAVEGNFFVKYNQTTRQTLIGHIKDREIRTFYVADGRDADPFQAAINYARELGGP